MTHHDPSRITCDPIAVRARTQTWRLTPHSSADVHMFFWVSKGTGRAQINGTTRGISPNTAVFIPAGTVHGFEFAATAAGWIIALPHDLRPDLELPDFPVQAVITRREEQTELIAICDEISREIGQDLTGRELALRCHAGLLSVWINRRLAAAIEARNPETRADRLMRRFAQLIENRYATNDSAADYARTLDVTPTHLTRVCRERFGKPATAVIQDRTILEARRKLAFSDERIAIIAETLGFATPAYFTRLFTQKTGTSPSEFRKRARKLPELGRLDSV